MNRRVLPLCAGLLLASELPVAASPPVELVLLLDTSHIKAGVDARAAQRFCRDLLENLPTQVRVRAFRFGTGPDLVPCDPLRSECFQEILGSQRTMPLQQALSKGEALLCGPEAMPEIQSRVLVLLGRSSGDETPILSGRCKTHVVALAVSPQDDPVLRDLASRSLGGYGLLGQIRGFTVASFIRNRIWRPAAQRLLSQGEAVPQDNRLPWLGSALAILSALLMTALWRFAKTPAPIAPVGDPLPRPHAAPEPATPGPRYEASLQIFGSTGRFPLSWAQPLILGGKRGSGFSPAHLVIDDPLIAEEHCQIQEVGGAFFVVDLDSGSGTFVNDERVDRRALAAGDRLRIGHTTFEFLAADPQER